jgi:ribosomal protein S18 acetylase RimI-like enzyme
MISEIRKMAGVKKKAYIWLGVWEHNTAAIRFYERLGFEKFAMHPYYIGKDRQTDWLMKMNLITLDSQKEHP